MKLIFRIFFLILFVFITNTSFAQFDDIESVTNKESNQKLKIWIKTLDSLKRSKKETPIVQVVSKILNKDPNNINALNVLGAFYLQNKKIKLAKIIFTRALKNHPKNSSVHNNLAIIALQENKPQEAIKYLRTSIGYKYSNYSAAANLGTLYIKSYEYDYALEYLELAYNSALKRLPITNNKVNKIGNNYAVALAWSGDFDKAEDIFKQLIKYNPTNIEVLLNYVILLGKDLKNKKSASYFLKKIELINRNSSYTRKIRAIKKYIINKI